VNAGQLQLELAIPGAQNGSRGPAPQPACPDSGENGAVSAPAPLSGRSRPLRDPTPFSDYAAAERLSGPRPWRELTAKRGALDQPEHAGAPVRCRCARPLPQRDGLETRCVKCGRRA